MQNLPEKMHRWRAWIQVWKEKWYGEIHSQRGAAGDNFHKIHHAHEMPKSSKGWALSTAKCGDLHSQRAAGGKFWKLTLRRRKKQPQNSAESRERAWLEFLS